MGDRLSVYEVRLPTRRPFVTAHGAVRERTVVLVGLTRDGITGWGEAAPFPGYSDESIEVVWDALSALDAPAAAPATASSPAALPPTAAAALDEARFDLAAKSEGRPLWDLIGGTSRPLGASLAVGMARSTPELLDVVAEAAEAGLRAIKLKIRPGADLEPTGALRSAFPDLIIGLDANGSYRWDDVETLRKLDRWDLAYLEQPFPAGELAAHAHLRRLVATPICLDESVPTLETLSAALTAGAADIIAVKPGLLGIAGVIRAAALAADAGAGLKASGLLETSIGKGHTVAVGTLPGVHFYDLSPASTTFTADVTGTPWTLAAGAIDPRLQPGIGVEPDRSLLDDLSRRRADYELASDVEVPSGPA